MKIEHGNCADKIDDDEDDDVCRGDLLEDIDLEAVLVATEEQSVDPGEYELYVGSELFSCPEQLNR